MIYEIYTRHQGKEVVYSLGGKKKGYALAAGNVLKSVEGYETVIVRAVVGEEVIKQWEVEERPSMLIARKKWKDEMLAYKKQKASQGV